MKCGFMFLLVFRHHQRISIYNNFFVENNMINAEVQCLIFGLSGKDYSQVSIDIKVFVNRFAYLKWHPGEAEADKFVSGRRLRNEDPVLLTNLQAM